MPDPGQGASGAPARNGARAGRFHRAGAPGGGTASARRFLGRPSPPRSFLLPPPARKMSGRRRCRARASLARRLWSRSLEGSRGAARSGGSAAAQRDGGARAIACTCRRRHRERPGFDGERWRLGPRTRCAGGHRRDYRKREQGTTLRPVVGIDPVVRRSGRRPAGRLHAPHRSAGRLRDARDPLHQSRPWPGTSYHAQHPPRREAEAHRRSGRSQGRRSDLPARPLQLRPACRVTLGSRPWSEIWIDGHRAGTTPLVDYPIACGTHDVLFLSREANVQHRESLTIQSTLKKVITLVEATD